MSGFGDIIDGITSGVTDWWNSDKNDGKGLDYTDIIALLGGAASASGLFDSSQKKVGYQGKIPDYTAVREQVPIDWNSDFNDDVLTRRKHISDRTASPEQAAFHRNWVNNGSNVPIGAEGRRPGEYGQRYFTDMTYAKSPNAQIPTVAQAQARANQQVNQLVNQNSRGGYAGGGIIEAMSNLRGGGMQKSPNSPPPMGAPPQAQGIAQAGQYLRGPSDGMGDEVNINAADGEFVMPADVVSHLGNGNSDAGAKQLEDMMARIRQARTGSTQQGSRINPNDFIPA